jgi:hypothetical protein
MAEKKKTEGTSGEKEDSDNNMVGKGKKMKAPSYVKSNSLGLIGVADAHDYFGSAAMNWEGGEEGERKIQQVKPQMGIRRRNAAWQKISMQKIYTNDSIDWLLGRLPTKESLTFSDTSQNLHRVYRDLDEAEKITRGDSAVALYEVNGRFYVLYKPTGEENTSRSLAALLEINLNDGNGEYRFGCWFSAMSLSGICGTKHVYPRKDLEGVITRNILALPLLTMKLDKPEITTSHNKFYLISDDWDERVKGGCFIKSHLTESLFTSWYE